MAAMAGTRFRIGSLGVSDLAGIASELYSASTTKEKGKENRNVLGTNPRNVIVIVKIESPIRSRSEPD